MMYIYIYILNYYIIVYCIYIYIYTHTQILVSLCSTWSIRRVSASSIRPGERHFVGQRLGLLALLAPDAPDGMVGVWSCQVEHSLVVNDPRIVANRGESFTPGFQFLWVIDNPHKNPLKRTWVGSAT